jgi:hypothetical protein
MKRLFVVAVAVLSLCGVTQAVYAFGELVTVPNGSAVPPGWVITQVLGGSGLWIIENLNGGPFGAGAEVINGSPVPTGWVVTRVLPGSGRWILTKT